MSEDSHERRDVEMRIALASETGLVVYASGSLVGAFSTTAELCVWLEETLGRFDPPREATLAMPSVAKPTADRPGRLGSRLFGLDGGKP